MNGNEEDALEKAKCDVEIRHLFFNRFAVADFVEEKGRLEIIKSKKQLVNLIYSFTSEGKRVCLYLPKEVEMHTHGKPVV